MNKDLESLVIMRVANGWIVRGPLDGPGYAPDTRTMMVARTPGELAQIVTDWAVKQQGGVEA